MKQQKFISPYRIIIDKNEFLYRSYARHPGVNMELMAGNLFAYQTASYFKEHQDEIFPPDELSGMVGVWDRDYIIEMMKGKEGT